MKNLKLLVGRILTSDILYHCIVAPINNSDLYKVKGYNLDLKNQPNFIKSSIFLGLYERSEINCIAKYLNPDLPVMELGCSIGATSMTILKTIKNKKLISVEANPLLLKNLQSTQKINNLSNWHIINKAVDYSGKDHISFAIDPGNLGSKKSETNSTDKDVLVPTVTISELLNAYKIDTNFNLVCDIEGAEIEFILNDSKTLKERCNTLIIELHDTIYSSIKYSKNEIAELIVATCEMKLIHSDNKSWIFVK
ncbi:FkbM family methyltransferase [Pedobacter helvus]|uniref:FkbM family methyltransferase n=1 Tax=Pedobacter helvus TaxID=2563444 RepID=A0ABW9JL72_9SPHI|nr:FkbM family methyltransferase [Pedobacter ureilyticus]